MKGNELADYRRSFVGTLGDGRFGWSVDGVRIFGGNLVALFG